MRKLLEITRNYSKLLEITRNYSKLLLGSTLLVLALFTFACQKENVVVAKDSNPNAEVTTQPTNNTNNGITSRETQDVLGIPCGVTVRVTVSGPCEYEFKLRYNSWVGSQIGAIEEFNALKYPKGVYDFKFKLPIMVSPQELRIFNDPSAINAKYNPNVPWFHAYNASAFVKVEIIPENGPSVVYIMNDVTGTPFIPAPTPANPKPKYGGTRVFKPKSVFAIWGCSIQE